MKKRRILKGASTYLDLDQKPTPMESDVELRNNQAPMNLLIDPDEDFDQIDTHFPIIAGKKKQILSDLIEDAGDEALPAEEAPAINAEPASGETPVSDVTKKEHTNKSKGSFTFNKGAMDASDPYTFGNTNVDYQKKDENQLEDLSKKRFWQIW